MSAQTEALQPDRPGRAPIETLDSLRNHLQWAIELEHSIIPPYLCALYSLDPQRNAEAAEVLTSVFMEEMLHLTLAANLLNAVGGRPVLDSPRLMPGYPNKLPHGEQGLQVSLLPFGPAAVAQFLRIEQPSPAGAPAEDDNYATIGQFYAAVELGLERLVEEFGEATVFSGDPARQVTPEAGYGGAGDIVVVHDLASALRALHEIVEQGEGAGHHDIWDGDHAMFHPDRDEVGHYYRLKELELGRRYRRGDSPATGPTGEAVAVDWDAVWPMRPNPRTADYEPGSPIRVRQEAFNLTYCRLLETLQSTFDGRPRALGNAVGLMYQLKATAQQLMQMPTEDDMTTAGPTFEYVDPAAR